MIRTLLTLIFLLLLIPIVVGVSGATTLETSSANIATESTSSPSASFEYSPEIPNPDDTISLDASDSGDSDGTITSYKWDTDGDGTYSEYNDDASDGETAIISYGSSGTYRVSLKVTDNDGNTNVTTRYIAVENPEPTASFEYSPRTPNPDNTISLDASASSDPDGSITSYKWDTDGDGSYSEYRDDVSDSQTTTIEFDTGGTYTIGLKVIDNGGKSVTTRKQITVENPEPTASFEFSPHTPNPDDTISLDASASSDPDGSITSYKWDTDGDGSYSEYRDDVSDSRTTAIEFDTGGTYTVGLKVIDNGGKSVTTRKQITVENPEPTASFEFSPQTPNPDDTISLDASASSDPDGSITSYKWDTDGDGTYSEYRDDVSDSRTTTIEYGADGTYTVGLKVTDNGGKSVTTRKQITVENPEPTASFEFSPQTPNPDDTISLDASTSSDPDGSITSYKWDTDGDGSYSEYRDDVSDSRTTAIEFDTGGTYTVGLKVIDNGGKSVTTRKQITVENPEPTASFEFSPQTPNPDDTISLDASASSDPDGTITSYKWDTDGDGTYSEYRDDVSDSRTTTIEYGTDGTYTVGLKVIDNGGKSVTTRKRITIENPEPTASFEFSPQLPNPGDTISLDASASSDPDGSITSYKWDTDGDGSYSEYRDDTSDGLTTTVTYDSAGSYTVGLKVTDNGGASVTNSTLIAVSLPPEPSLDTSTEAVGRDQSVTFDASDSTDPDGEVTEFVWRFDDGQTERGETVRRSFSELGHHEVTLIVVDDTGHRVETASAVTVYPKPSATIAVEPEEPIAGSSVRFEARSDDNIDEYEWDIDDDGITDYTGASIAHTFEKSGDYTVTMTATSEDGIENQMSYMIPIEPDASFELTSNLGTVESGETAVVTFSVTNNIPDRPVNTRLQLDLPSTGVSIAGVEGGSVASRSSTNFVTIPGGEQKSLQVRMRFNEQGDHTIGAQSAYYYGSKSNIRQKSIDPIEVAVIDDGQTEATDGSPGFGTGSALVAIFLAVAAATHREW